jgi:hypothetical protein
MYFDGVGTQAGVYWGVGAAIALVLVFFYACVWMGWVCRADEDGPLREGLLTSRGEPLMSRACLCVWLWVLAVLVGLAPAGYGLSKVYVVVWDGSSSLGDVASALDKGAEGMVSSSAVATSAVSEIMNTVVSTPCRDAGHAELLPGGHCLI